MHLSPLGKIISIKSIFLLYCVTLTSYAMWQKHLSTQKIINKVVGNLKCRYYAE